MATEREMVTELVQALELARVKAQAVELELEQGPHPEQVHLAELARALVWNLSDALQGIRNAERQRRARLLGVAHAVRVAVG